MYIICKSYVQYKFDSIFVRYLMLSYLLSWFNNWL
ncbi:Uncharacterised protein [Salmonella enterica subsp. enterica serovar Sanjuan]|uniref:Uncharacterized protein n=1 Tax=Salmonella enterica subsp. enterica serovar Sanjuan TaxID=1160765 RepID=A0A3S4FI89_SALET|nr:Uncharacterised protein [Salmonella enterica subsp. enterica serovar Sanjuan]